MEMNEVKTCCELLKPLWKERYLNYIHGLYELGFSKEVYDKKGKWLGREITSEIVNYCPFCGKSLQGIYETTW